MHCYQNFLLYHVKYKFSKFLAKKHHQTRNNNTLGLAQQLRPRDNFWAIGTLVLAFSSTFLSTYLGIHWVNSVSPSTLLGRFRHFNQHRHWIPPTG